MTAPNPSTWFTNVLVSASIIKANLTDYINTALAQSNVSSWTTLTIKSGYQAVGAEAPAWALFGTLVIFRGKVAPNTGSFSTNSSVTAILSGLPTAQQPNVNQNFMIAGSGSSYSSANLVANTDGTFDLFTGSNVPAGSNGYDLATMSFLAGQ